MEIHLGIRIPDIILSSYHFSCFIPRKPALVKKNLLFIILSPQMFVSIPQTIFVMATSKFCIEQFNHFNPCLKHKFMTNFIPSKHLV